MKQLITLLIVVLSGGLQAQDVYQDETQALLYFKIPFSASNTYEDTSLKMGFTVDTQYSEAYLSQQPAAFNPAQHPFNHLAIEYSTRTKYFSRFNVGGIDALTYQTVLNADGSTTQWPMGLSTTQVVLGAIAGAGIGYLICELVCGDDDDRNNNGQQQPQPSDMRLKKDIVYLATLENGIRLYSFRYIRDDATVHVGVMAQDLLGQEAYRDAVIMMKTGFYAVNYEKLGLRMVTLNEWNLKPQSIYVN